MAKKTYILDTNVYGKLLIEEKGEELIEEIKTDKRLYVYGVNIIEKELEDIPSDIKYRKGILKESIINIYESIIKKELKLVPLAKHLASEYYKEFDKLRKSGKYYKTLSAKVKKYDKEDLKADFEIIAIASIENIDIVVSTDKRTMLSEIAEKTYNKVNKINELRTPQLLNYSEFIGRYLNE